MQNRKCRKDSLAISITLNIMKPVKTEAVEERPSVLPVLMLLQGKHTQATHKPLHECSRAMSDNEAPFSFLETERHTGAWDLTRILICRSYLEKGQLFNHESLKL